MEGGKKQNYISGLIDKLFSMYTKKNDMPAFEKPADQLEFEASSRTKELSDLCQHEAIGDGKGRFYYTVLVSTTGNMLMTSSEDVRNLQPGQGYYTISLPTKLKGSSSPGYPVPGIGGPSLGVLFDSHLKQYPIEGARLVPGSIVIKEMESTGSGAATVGRVWSSVPTYLDDLRKQSSLSNSSIASSGAGSGGGTGAGSGGTGVSLQTGSYNGSYRK